MCTMSNGSMCTSKFDLLLPSMLVAKFDFLPPGKSLLYSYGWMVNWVLFFVLSNVQFEE